jgi:hypothetical protein
MRRLAWLIAAILFGSLAIWLLFASVIWHQPVRDSDLLKEMTLRPGTLSTSARFEVPERIPFFYVHAIPNAGPEVLRLVIYQGESVLFNGSIREEMRIQCGRDLPPGTYFTAMSQPRGGAGGRILIADRHPWNIKGWHIALAGILVLLTLATIRRTLKTKTNH